MYERKKRFSKDISGKDGTIGHVFESHIQELLGSKSISDLRAQVSRLFTDNQISTPKSRLIQLKLSHMSLVQGITYVKDVWLAAKGLATYG